ncbi:hypothetical protein HY087_02940 [Candidatus Gottesmanbacteria bacterium]|nr:hypothetical protein [Candidatus Gottesmanbacteria bacterium]
MKTIFLIASILLPLYSLWPYIRSIIHGDTKPHRTTRFVYLVIGMLTTTSLLASHDGVAFWISAVSTVQAIVLFYFGLSYGVGGWSRTDIACLAMAVIGIVAWQTTKNPVYGLYFGIGADFAGTVPTIIKTYHHPETENWQFYGLDALAGFFNMLAIRTITPATSSYPLYLILVNGLIALLVLGKRNDTRVLG